MKEYLKLSESDLKKIGGLVDPGEVFAPVESQKGWYISNFGRLISFRRNEPCVMKTFFRNGYEYIITRNTVNGKRIATQHAIHKMVADAFLEVPDWIKEGDVIEIHHFEKVNKKKRIPFIHRAENLGHAPKCIHRVIDAVEEVAIYENDKYESYEFIEASFKLGIDPYQLADIVREEADLIVGRYMYYYRTIKRGNKAVDINIRVKRYGKTLDIYRKKKLIRKVGV